MKAPIALTLASLLLLSACESATHAPASPEAEAPPQSRTYRCESGETVVAAYSSTDAAVVRYKGRDYRMRIAISGSGARYTGEGLEWWTKGSGTGAMGMLSRLQEDGTSGALLESCEES